jgi:pimeloyl-ACP methyl ester carboxylesterase
VAGLILVDAGDGNLETYMADTVYLQTMHQFINLSQTLSETGLIKVVAGASVLFSGTAMAYEELGAANAETLQAMAVKTTEAGTAEVAALPVIWEENRATPASLGNLPLIVIVHGYCNSCSRDPLELEKEEQGWLAMQQYLASLSSNSQLIQADPETGHDIQIDQPQLIVDAILELLAQGK